MLAVILSAVLILLSLVLIQAITRHDVKKELLSLDHTDIIKGASIVLIIIGHIGIISGSRYFNPLGIASLSAFLICSGIGLQKSYEKSGLKGFFIKKFIRIIIPYWIGVAAYFALNPAEFTFLFFIENMFLIKTYNFWWFIQFITVGYIVFYLVYRFIPDKFRIPVLAVLSLAFFVSQYSDLTASQSFSITLGILLSKYTSKKALSNRKILIGGIGSLAAGVIFFVFKQLPFIHDGIIIIYNFVQVLISVFLAAAMISFTYLLMKLFIVRMLAAAGKASYELYITHTVFIFIISDTLTETIAALYIAVTGIASFAFYYINKFITKKLTGILPNGKKSISR